MSDRKKAFWFIALLSVLVVVPFLGETIFYSKGEPREAIVALSMLERRQKKNRGQKRRLNVFTFCHKGKEHQLHG